MAEMTDNGELLEALAAIEHDRWAHWQRYMHSKFKRLRDGDWAISAALFQRWDNQIATAYADLTETEKESDREQVRKYMPLIEVALREAETKGADREHEQCCRDVCLGCLRGHQLTENGRSHIGSPNIYPCAAHPIRNRSQT